MLSSMTLYDIRILYLARRDMSDETFLISIGLMKLLDALDTDNERVDLINKTLKVFSSLTDIVRKGPLPDSDYMNSQHVDSSERTKRLRAARQSKKSIEHTLAHLGWFDNLAIEYFKNNIIGSPKDYDIYTLLMELEQLADYSKSSLPQGAEAILAVLETKGSELKRIKEFGLSVDDRARLESAKQLETVKQQIAAIDNSIKQAQEEIEQNIARRIGETTAKLETELDPIIRRANTLRTQVEVTSRKMMEMQQTLDEKLSLLTEALAIDPHTSLINLVTETEILLARMDATSKENVTKSEYAIKGIAARMRNLQLQIESKSRVVEDSSILCDTLTELASQLNTITANITETTSLTKGAVAAATDIKHAVGVLKMETDIYKTNAFRHVNEKNKIEKEIKG